MKRFFLVLLLVLLAVFLMGCACDSLSIDGVNLVQAQEKCKDDSDPNHCYKKLAKSSLNPKICDFIMKEGTKGKCLIEVALSINDPGICEDVAGYYTKEQCYYELAKEMNDASLCNNIPESYTHDGDDITGAFTVHDCMRVATGKTKEKLCGFIGAPCCAGYMCEDTGCSITYRCESCGDLNMPCCFGDANIGPSMGCGGNLTCSDAGVCTS